ncbi:MAG: ABC transporter ATP-binding protein [Desulfobacteraceae bacterium]|nr:MAG: ABC transporter ATP-binding protein [Desulfobacteraceae bacterium]
MGAIVAEKLAKRFGNVHALEDVSFKVSKGELFGFLGPNGAGKTTTINILTGLARPDTGAISISGIDCTHSPKAAQGLIGVVPDESNLYPELTGFDNLCFCASLYGLKKSDRVSRAAELLRSLGLAEAASRKFGGYSKGMKRKLTIAAGIIHNPPILFLDEPTTGIDVASARQIRQLISGLNRSGTTILLTTHYIEEAERLCSRIAFIASGKIIKTDTIENLIQPAKEKNVMEITLSKRAKISFESMASAFPNLSLSCPEDGRIRVESGEPIRAGVLVRYLEENGHEVMEARRIHPSLEDVFVRITGIEAGAMKKEREKSIL